MSSRFGKTLRMPCTESCTTMIFSEGYWKFFFGNLDEHLAQLVEARAHADRDKCVALLHKLGSGAKSVGAAELGAALKQTEIATKDMTLPLFEVTLVEDLKQLALASKQAISKCFDE